MNLSMQTLNAQELKAMVHAGQSILESKVEYVNALNVFPVPDGDTGTNMNLTFTSGFNSIQDHEGNHIGQFGEELSRGLLMGARGNSGVILNQLFRGFCQYFKDEEEINAKTFAEAFENGAKLAYKTMMKPREGTILTVAREAAEAGIQKAKTTDDIIEVMTAVFEASQVSLENTPNLLPILKEVGVVDSGGQGLVYIYQGFMSSLTGEHVELTAVEEDIESLDLSSIAHDDVHSSDAMSTEDIEFGYCTEIMVRLGEGETVEEEFDYDEFRDTLANYGDSLIVVSDDEIAKVHIHTERPGDIMNLGQKYGSLVAVKADNMREQHRTLKAAQKGESAPVKKEKLETVVIAVASGEGLADIFKGFGVNVIIQGGQTMNPSTEDFLKAIESVDAQKAILLPNNSNIFLAAQTAAENASIPTGVVPTKNISQGITSMLAYNETVTVEENVESMTSEMEVVKNGQVTYAVRDTQIDGLDIKKDDFMGLIDGDVILTEKEKADAAEATLQAMIDEDSELVTIIFGEDVSQEEADELAEKIEEQYEDVEVEVFDGGTPVYSYTFSVE